MDKRVEKNKSNVLKLRDFLLELCSNHNYYSSNEQVLKALTSQGNFAKYENKEIGIEASSLNTLKRTCEKLFDNGFDELDKLRIIALEKLTSTSKDMVGRNTKDFYIERCSKLELELEQQKQINLLAIHELMNEIQLLKNIKNVKEISLVHGMCDKHIARLQAHALQFAEFAPLKKETSLKVIKGGKDE